MCTGNYKTSQREMKKKTKYKEICCVYGLGCWFPQYIPTNTMKSEPKSQQAIFSSLVEIDRLILKLTWNCKGLKVAKTIFLKKVEELH